MLAVLGCGQTTSREEDGPAGAGQGPAGNSGVAGGGGRLGSGGATVGVGIGGAGVTLPPSNGGTGQDNCVQPGAGARLFDEQGVHDEAPAVRELFTWTTPEQIAELRAGARLLSRSEREGMGPGYVYVALAELARASTAGDEKGLADLLLTEAFARARFAWPNPWATRMGWPGESYGGELVRIELRAEAYLVLFRSRSLSVVDMENRQVPIALALANPERIAGLYFVKDYSADGPPLCGSFQDGGAGYREFVVANEGMIAEWSLATATIRARLESDIQLLAAFRERTRGCASPADDVAAWQRRAFCRYSDTDVWDAYHHALAMPNENYFPEPPQLERMLATLRADLFVPDPFVVTLDP